MAGLTVTHEPLRLALAAKANASDLSALALLIASGTYTPTLTSVANVADKTAYQCQYLQVGTTVTVSGRVDIDPTLTATTTQLGISLPVASNFGAAEDCAGVAFCPSVATMGAAVVADAANNRAQIEFVSSEITNQPFSFTFSYQVIA